MVTIEESTLHLQNLIKLNFMLNQVRFSACFLLTKTTFFHLDYNFLIFQLKQPWSKPHIQIMPNSLLFGSLTLKNASPPLHCHSRLTRKSSTDLKLWKAVIALPLSVCHRGISKWQITKYTNRFRSFESPSRLSIKVMLIALSQAFCWDCIILVSLVFTDTLCIHYHTIIKVWPV